MTADWGYQGNLKVIGPVIVIVIVACTQKSPGLEIVLKQVISAMNRSNLVRGMLLINWYCIVHKHNKLHIITPCTCAGVK